MESRSKKAVKKEAKKKLKKPLKKPGGKKLFNFFLNLFGKKTRKSFATVISHLVETYEKEGLISGEEKYMFKNIASFGSKKVFDIMTPRSDMIAVPFDASLEDVEQLISQHGHTRMPVYKKNFDEIIGFIHIKDLAKFLSENNEDFSLSKIMRKILFVPCSMKLADLMMRMKMSRIHIASVLDEFGGVDGLVTIEDAVEEIVGDIEDEHDSPSENAFFKIKEVNKNIFQFGGRVEIEKFEEILKMSIRDEDEDFETVNGFVMTAFSRIPLKSEIIKARGLEIKVIDADEKVVKLVEIEKLEEQEEALEDSL